MVLFITEIVVLKQLKLLYTRAGTFLHGSLHNSDCIVLQQSKLLYTRAGTLLYGFLEALYCGAAVIEVAIIYAYYIGLRTLFFRGKICVQYSSV